MPFRQFSCSSVIIGNSSQLSYTRAYTQTSIFNLRISYQYRFLNEQTKKPFATAVIWRVNTSFMRAFDILPLFVLFENIDA